MGIPECVEAFVHQVEPFKRVACMKSALGR